MNTVLVLASTSFELNTISNFGSFCFLCDLHFGIRMYTYSIYLRGQSYVGNFAHSTTVQVVTALTYITFENLISGDMILWHQCSLYMATVVWMP